MVLRNAKRLVSLIILMSSMRTHKSKNVFKYDKMVVPGLFLGKINNAYLFSFQHS